MKCDVLVMILKNIRVEKILGIWRFLGFRDVFVKNGKKDVVGGEEGVCKV